MRRAAQHCLGDAGISPPELPTRWARPMGIEVSSAPARRRTSRRGLPWSSRTTATRGSSRNCNVAHGPTSRRRWRCSSWPARRRQFAEAVDQAARLQSAEAGEGGSVMRRRLPRLRARSWLGAEIESRARPLPIEAFSIQPSARFPRRGCGRRRAARVRAAPPARPRVRLAVGDLAERSELRRVQARTAPAPAQVIGEPAGQLARNVEQVSLWSNTAFLGGEAIIACCDLRQRCQRQRRLDHGRPLRAAAAARAMERLRCGQLVRDDVGGICGSSMARGTSRRSKKPSATQTLSASAPAGRRRNRGSSVPR